MRLMRIICATCCLVTGNPGMAAPFEIDFVETDDLLMIYQDPFQTYLVPHMSKSFHNSVEFQKYLFNWSPREKTSVVLTDFSDYGNASY